MSATPSSHAGRPGRTTRALRARTRHARPGKRPDAEQRCKPAWTVEAARLRDVPLLLQMVVEAAQDGDLNPQLLDWRYQIGLAKGLFATLLWGRFTDEHTGRQRAALFVVRDGQRLAGFSLIRAWSPPPSTSPARTPSVTGAKELYLVCVDRAMRRQGVGQALVQHAVNHAPHGLVALVLRHGRGMAQILQHLQASACGQVALGHHARHVPVQAYALGEPQAREHIARALASASADQTDRAGA